MYRAGALLLILLGHFFLGTWGGLNTTKPYVANLVVVGSWGANMATNNMVNIAQFAANNINAQFDLAPDVEINLIKANCGTGSGNPSKCLVLATQLVTTYGENNVTGFLTGPYTNDQRVLQFVAAAFNLPHIVGIASGNILANKLEYPTLLRTSVPDSVGNMLMIKFMVENGWKSAAVALDDSDWGQGNSDALQKYAVQYGVELQIVSCPLGSFNYTQQAQVIKASGMRILIIVLQPRENFVFMDAANKTGIVGPNYAWMLSVSSVLGLANSTINTYQPLLPGFNLTGLRPLFDGAIGMSPRGGIGPLFDELKPAFSALYPGSVNSYSWFIYDAVTAYARGLQQMLNRGVPWVNCSKLSLLHELWGLDFNGTTGRIKFDANGDRTGPVDIINVQPWSTVNARLYDPETNNYTIFFPIKYFGGSLTPPADAIHCDCEHGTCTEEGDCICEFGYYGSSCHAKFKEHSVALSGALAAVVAASLIICIIGLFLLKFYRQQFITKSIIFCGLIFVGAIIIYISAFTLLPEPTDNLCMAFPWLLGVGFTLVYGCLFLKTWRIYRMIESSMKFERVLITNQYLAKMVGVALAVEITFMIIWTVVDPLEAKLHIFKDDSARLMCRSDHEAIFWAIFGGYKFLWMIFGAYMAIKTRYYYEQYNDSKSIALCIYNTLTMLTIGVPIAVSMRDFAFVVTVIEVALIVIIFNFAIISLFLNTWIEIIYGAPPVLPELRTPTPTQSTGTTRSGSSKDEKNTKQQSGSSHSSS